jgi:ribosomal protein S18 acetylase RimI-like enzyme
MEYIRVTKENIEKEHICCAISSNKDIQVISKKNWLKERFDDGLVFLKSIERGKCFIEYIPAENAWNPIKADGYMYIDCLWVAGSFKGNGYSTDLLNACIEDSKAKGSYGTVLRIPGFYGLGFKETIRGCCRCLFTHQSAVGILPFFPP